jgi:hypothetical protein
VTRGYLRGPTVWALLHGSRDGYGHEPRQASPCMLATSQYWHAPLLSFVLGSRPPRRWYRTDLGRALTGL